MSMRVVSTADLRVLNTTLVAEFINGYEGAPLIYPEMCTPVPSTSKNNTYPLRAGIPQMREWTGERNYNAIAAHSYIIENKHYELTMSVDADDIKDHSYGGALLDARMLGDRGKTHPDVLLQTILQTGQSIPCFDGQNFFDTAHYVNVKNKTGSQRNYYASGSGKTLTATTWEEVRGIMGAFQDDAGEPIGVRPTHVAVAPSNEGVARRIFEAEKDAAGASNVNYKTAKVIVHPRLANNPTEWYALDLSGPIKPFIFQMREAMRFVMMTDVTDENVFRHNRFDYGVDGRWAVGAAMWFRAFKVVP